MSTNFEINNRTIYIDPEIKDIVVQGDTNSKTIIFNLQNRFFDGIDLSSKPIKIGYQNALGETDYEDAYLNTIDLESFTFSWTLSGNIAVKDGTVNIFVEFQEVNSSEEKVYVWKTKPITFNVEPTFEVLGNAMSLDYTAQQLFYSNNDNNTLSSISDTNEPIYIDNRRILIPILEDLVVSGDNKSQIISFTMPRYFENVDLSQKVISIKFINAQGQGDRTRVVNLIVTETDITFGWLIDSKATIKDGYVQFAIEFFGYENGEWYCWSTVPAQFEVSKGLDVDGLVEAPLPSWIQSFEMQASELLAQKTNEIDGVITNASGQFEAKYNGLETEYSGELNTIKTSLSDTNSRFDNVVANVTVDSEVILSRGEYDTLQNRLDANDEDFNSKVDFAIVDSKTGESIQTTVADDFKVDITTIEGATTVTPTNPDLDISPDNVATITSAKDFDVVACGKNLIPYPYYHTTMSHDGISYTDNGDGSVNAVGTATNFSYFYLARPIKLVKGLTYTISGGHGSGKGLVLIPLIDGIDGNPVWADGIIATTSVTFTPVYEYYRIAIQIAPVAGAINLKFYPQLELGAVANPYEIYKGNNKITISSIVRGLPNGVCDTVERIDDKYVKYTQRIGKVVFDGSEDEEWEEGIRFVNDYIGFAGRAQGIVEVVDSVVISDRFKTIKGDHNIQLEALMKPAMNQGVVIGVLRSRLQTTDVSGFRAFLQANPVTVLYELETPIETIVEEPSALTSYKGITNVFTTAMAQPKLTVDFKSRLKNTTEILLAEIAKLKQAIISLGGTV